MLTGKNFGILSPSPQCPNRGLTCDLEIEPVGGSNPSKPEGFVCPQPQPPVYIFIFLYFLPGFLIEGAQELG